VLQALITFATEAAGEEETSKTPFYIAGIVLTAFAVIVSAIGIRAHGRFPSSPGVTRLVMALAVTLVALTLASAVLTG
jgi:hypothetical protein